MQNFIEVYRTYRDNAGEILALPFLVNLSHVKVVRDSGKYATLEMVDGGEIKTANDYEQIRGMIGTAQGSVPGCRRFGK